tara:strand:- start:1467 stop:1613 length:147 start_codon:yes stop_codon:yes gene_type:complete
MFGRIKGITVKTSGTGAINKDLIYAIQHYLISFKRKTIATNIKIMNYK